MENNNKESFKLLEPSGSESISEQNDLVLTKRKKRFRRRLKNNPSIRHEDSNCLCKPRTIVTSMFFVILTCWLIVLTWLAVVLHGEIARLSEEVKTVVAGSQNVPETLQRCHSMSRDLQKNQTHLFQRITTFTQQLTNVSLEMNDIKTGLHSVQEQLKSPVGLVNDPRIINDLSTSVASFGSHIQDLESTVTTLKDTNNKLEETVRYLVSNVTDIKVRLEHVANVTMDNARGTSTTTTDDLAALVTLVNNVVSNLTSINETLSNKLQWTVDDQTKDHQLIESLQDMNQNITARVRTLESSTQQQSPVVNTTREQVKTVEQLPLPPPQQPVNLPTTEGVTVLPADIVSSKLPP